MNDSRAKPLAVCIILTFSCRRPLHAVQVVSRGNFLLLRQRSFSCHFVYLKALYYPTENSLVLKESVLESVLFVCWQINCHPDPPLSSSGLLVIAVRINALDSGMGFKLIQVKMHGVRGYAFCWGGG